MVDPRGPKGTTSSRSSGADASSGERSGDRRHLRPQEHRIGKGREPGYLPQADQWAELRLQALGRLTRRPE